MSSAEMVQIPKEEYVQMKTEIETLRHSKLYQRLLDFMQNIRTGKRYTRKDIGF